MGMSCSVVPGMADSTGRYLARELACGSYWREVADAMSLRGGLGQSQRVLAAKARWAQRTPRSMAAALNNLEGL